MEIFWAAVKYFVWKDESNTTGIFKAITTSIRIIFADEIDKRILSKGILMRIKTRIPTVKIILINRDNFLFI
jgi:hypothetical protein